jgi:hypothetical protein
MRAPSVKGEASGVFSGGVAAVSRRAHAADLQDSVIELLADYFPDRRSHARSAEWSWSPVS